MEGGCEADFASFLAVDLDKRSSAGPGYLISKGGQHTPFRVALAAALAFALCLPPIGAVKTKVSISAGNRNSDLIAWRMM